MISTFIVLCIFSSTDLNVEYSSQKDFGLFDTGCLDSIIAQAKVDSESPFFQCTMAEYLPNIYDISTIFL
jgi:hypothetical protein